MHVMNWDTNNNCPTHFCHAFQVLLGHQSIHWKHAPCLLHARPPVTQMSALCLWFMEADLQAASSCSNPCLDECHPRPPVWLQLSLRPAYPGDAGSTSSQTEPVQGVAGGFTSYIQNEAQALSPLPHSSCPIPLPCLHPKSHGKDLLLTS